MDRVKEPKLLLLDATNAMMRRAASKPDIAPLDIARDVLQRVVIAARYLHCTHLIACFDSPEASWRCDELPEYKRGSEGGTIPYVNAAIQCWGEHGVCRVQVPRMEADDLVGTLAFRAEAAGRQAYTLSSDNDLLQLAAAARVMQYAPMGESPWLVQRTPEYVQERFGVAPKRYPHYLALVGGKNGVPGAKGIGPKRAAKIIEEARVAALTGQAALEDAIASIAGVSRPWLERTARIHTLRHDAPLRPIHPNECGVPRDVD